MNKEKKKTHKIVNNVRTNLPSMLENTQSTTNKCSLFASSIDFSHSISICVQENVAFSGLEWIYLLLRSAGNS